jgi:hypothetical protein
MTSEKTTRNAQVAEKYIVRFPPGMRDKIARAADSSDRSMNAEIIHRLESSFSVIVDEVSLMTALKVLNGYAAKFDCTVSLSVSSTPLQILSGAIKSGTLPADATLDDLNDPTEAIARLRAQQLAEKTTSTPAKRPRAPKPKG